MGIINQNYLWFKIISESGKYLYTVHGVPLEALLKYKMSKLR